MFFILISRNGKYVVDQITCYKFMELQFEVGLFHGDRKRSKVQFVLHFYYCPSIRRVIPRDEIDNAAESVHKCVAFGVA